MPQYQVERAFVATQPEIADAEEPIQVRRFSSLFRFEQEAGGRLGRDIATSVFKNNLRPIDDPE